MADAVVRLNALDAGWETVGRDRLAGIMPEGIQCSSNDWGSDTCRFTLRRDPRAVYPDLGAFTPCEIEVGSELVWSGRVWETPTKDGDDGGINIEGRGWQYHLDDDMYPRLFVHTNLSEYKDSRSYPGTALTTLKQNGSVQAEDGGIILAFPSGVVEAINDGAAVTMDLGPDAKAKAVSMDFSMINAVTGWTVIVRVHDEVDVRNAVNYTDVITFTGASVPSSPTSGTATVGRRYVSVIFRADAAGTTSADRGIKITGMRVFANAAHLSSNASILKVSDIVSDALPVASLLNQSTARISPTTFNVPEAYWFDYKTPREVINAFNAYHNNRARVDVDGYLRYDAYPTVPIFEAGSWQGVQFEDASANSGETIYNHVIVEATGPDGAPLRVSRSTSQIITSAPRIAVPISFPNPSFEVDAANWTPTFSTFVRTTTAGEFYSGSGGGKWTPSNSSGTVYTTLSGTFKAGVTYEFSWVIMTSIAKLGFVSVTMLDGVTGNSIAVLRGNANGIDTTTSFATTTTTWTPTADATNPRLLLGVNAAPVGAILIDDFAVNRVAPTAIDRRGFTRTAILSVESRVISTAASQLGDTFLQNHRTTPLRGGGTVEYGGVRQIGSGSQVHPATLLANTGELIRFTDRIDPDTGAMGRDGRIVSVNYNHDSEQATIAIDNERRNFEALLARYGAIVGAGRS